MKTIILALMLFAATGIAHVQVQDAAGTYTVDSYGSAYKHESTSAVSFSMRPSNQELGNTIERHCFPEKIIIK